MSSLPSKRKKPCTGGALKTEISQVVVEGYSFLHIVRCFFNCILTDDDKHSSDMKANRLEILQKVYNRELTPEQAENKLLGLSIVGRSTLLKAVKGDRVKCKYGNSGNKFWTDLLEQQPTTVDKIQFDENAGFCRFTFQEDERVDNYFYENDFEKA